MIGAFEARQPSLLRESSNTVLGGVGMSAGLLLSFRPPTGWHPADTADRGPSFLRHSLSRVCQRA